MFDKLKNIFGAKPTESVNVSQERPKSNILIVEDNELDRRIVKTALEKSGYQVTTAENGQVGLNMVNSKRPDLAILDCEMPVMDGLELCRKMKENVHTKSIPVVFLTSIDTPKNIIDCFELEAENFLAKPINIKILINRVKEILEERDQKDKSAAE